MLKGLSEQEFNETMVEKMYSHFGLPPLPPEVFEEISKEDDDKIRKLHQELSTAIGRAYVDFEMNIDKYSPEIKSMNDEYSSLNKEAYPNMRDVIVDEFEALRNPKKLDSNMTREEWHLKVKRMTKLRESINKKTKELRGNREKAITEKFATDRKKILSKYNLKFSVGGKIYKAE